METKTEQPPECAVPLQGAWKRFADPILLAELQQIPPVPSRRVISSGWVSSWRETGDSRFQDRQIRQQNLRSDKKRKLNRKIADGIRTQLREGELVAWGLEGNPNADWVRLRREAWDYLKPNWRNGTVTARDGTVFYSVRVLPALIADHRPLEGEVSLSKAYKFFVEYGKIDDEFRTSFGETESFFGNHSTLSDAVSILRQKESAWADVFDQERPGYRMYGYRRRFSGAMMGAWVTPAKPDLWKGHEQECRFAARSYGMFDDDDLAECTNVPELAVSVHALRRRLEAQLLLGLATGTMRVRGTTEILSPPINFSPETIGPAFFQRDESVVCFDENLLFHLTSEFDGRKIGGGELIPEKWLVKVFTNVLVCQPGRFEAEDAKATLPKNDKVMQPRFSEDTVTKAYIDRVKNWPAKTAPPSRADDEKWGNGEFNATRNFMRKLRKEYATHWSRQGPKTKYSIKNT